MVTTAIAIQNILNEEPNSIIYRVYGGCADQYGGSWSPVDPRTVANYRNFAGLPNCNTGEYLFIGRLIDKTGVVSILPAEPLDGNEGGLLEYRIKRPQDLYVEEDTVIKLFVPY